MEFGLRSIPKIKLETTADALYVSSALRSAAQNILDDHSKSIGNNAALFDRAETLVSETIETSVLAAAANIQINGLDWIPSEPADKDMEPYDEGLHRRLLDLQVELEKWTIQVTTQRKHIPLKIKHFMETTLSERTKKIISDPAPNIDEPMSVAPTEYLLSTNIRQDYESSLLLMSELAREAATNLSALQRTNDVCKELADSISSVN